MVSCDGRLGQLSTGMLPMLRNSSEAYERRLKHWSRHKHVLRHFRATHLEDRHCNYCDEPVDNVTRRHQLGGGSVISVSSEREEFHWPIVFVAERSGSLLIRLQYRRGVLFGSAWRHVVAENQGLLTVDAQLVDRSLFLPLIELHVLICSKIYCYKIAKYSKLKIGTNNERN